MAYVPQHEADVFISYSHEDDFAWIERFTLDLESALRRKLRARTSPKIFFDRYDLRAGRKFDQDIPSCLARSGFFVAVITPRYHSSSYCKHKELTKFCSLVHPEGRVIQVRLDPSVEFPLSSRLGVDSFNGPRVFRSGSEEYDQMLRRVYEPIVSGLDELYAESKMIFLSWAADDELEREREDLRLEIEGRGFRVYPQEIGEHEDNVAVKLRRAFDACTASVHFFGDSRTDSFAERQLAVARESRRPCVVASRDRAEIRRGSEGSPPPVYLGHGNPTIAIANAIEELTGRSKRDERDARVALGKIPLFLVFKPDSDATLGLRVRQMIVNRGPFEVLEPPRGAERDLRYGDLHRARAALLCWGRADREWFSREFEAMNVAVAEARLYELLRARLLAPLDGKADQEIVDGEVVLETFDQLGTFLDGLKAA